MLSFIRVVVSSNTSLLLLSSNTRKASWSILTILVTSLPTTFCDALWETLSALLLMFWTFGQCYLENSMDTEPRAESGV